MIKQLEDFILKHEDYRVAYDVFRVTRYKKDYDGRLFIAYTGKTFISTTYRKDYIVYSVELIDINDRPGCDPEADGVSYTSFEDAEKSLLENMKRIKLI